MIFHEMAKVLKLIFSIKLDYLILDFDVMASSVCFIEAKCL